jgi:hypothetical protein
MSAVGLVAIILLFAPFARAEERLPMIEIMPAGFTAGATQGWGQCPCFRWTATVRTMGGTIETRHFVISSDALFRLQQEQTIDLSRYTRQLYTMGALEALWKGGHVGITFDGVTVGTEIDRGYSDIVRTGIHALVNIVRTESLRLDIRSGYQFEQMRVNLGEEISRELLPQSLSFGFRTAHWHGRIAASVGLDAARPLELDHALLRGELGFGVHFMDESAFRWGLSLNTYVERDPFREALGLAGDQVTAILSLDLSWMPKVLHGRKEDR